MNLKCGLVGLPNVGKSTLFNNLAQKSVPTANYPFCTIKPNSAVIPIYNRKLEQLHTAEKSSIMTPATLCVTDIAGLIQGASINKGMGNSFLQDIRSVDIILYVVRCFDDENIIHVNKSVDPVRDLITVQNELILADLIVLESHINSKKASSLQIKKCTHRAQLLQETLWPSRGISTLELKLFTDKPVLIVANGDCNKHLYALQQYCNKYFLSLLPVSYTTGAESLTNLVQRAYDLLGWTTFFTTGTKETRAWSIRKSATAIEASGTIHSDFQKRFIRAKVLPFDLWSQYGSLAKAEQCKQILTVGKDYVVQPNDIINFAIKR